MNIYETVSESALHSSFFRLSFFLSQIICPGVTAAIGTETTGSVTYKT